MEECERSTSRFFTISVHFKLHKKVDGEALFGEQKRVIHEWLTAKLAAGVIQRSDSTTTPPLLVMLWLNPNAILPLQPTWQLTTHVIRFKEECLFSILQ